MTEPMSDAAIMTTAMLISSHKTVRCAHRRQRLTVTVASPTTRFTPAAVRRGNFTIRTRTGIRNSPPPTPTNPAAAPVTSPASAAIAFSRKLKQLLDGFDDARVAASVSRQVRHCRLKFSALHYRQDSLHQIQLQEILAANKEVVFGGQSNEVEVELARCSLDAKTDVRHITGDIGSNGQMRELHLFVSCDAGAVDVVLQQDLVEEEPCTGLRITIHEPHRRLEQVSDGTDAQRIAALHHQAHFPSHESDHA